MLENASLPSCQRQHDCLPFDALGSDLHLLWPLRGACPKSEESARHNRSLKGCCACCSPQEVPIHAKQQHRSLQHRSLLRFCQRWEHCWRGWLL